MNLRKPLSLATIPAILIASLLTACLQEIPEQAQGPGGKGPTGQANLSLKLEKVGALRKAVAIEMDTLFIGLTATGEAPVLDTVLLSGNSLQAILKSYPGLASLKTWTLGAIAKDQNGMTVYSGTTEFIVPPNGTANVPLTLAPHFSMLRALFFPIRDSVTQVQLRVDGSLVAAESFAKQSRLGDTVALTHDYLAASPAGTTHAIRMDVRGDMWGFDTVLYRGNTGITVVSGKDTSYSLTLHWVGPAVPPPGQATITVTLGAVGSVTLRGTLEDTVAVPVNYAWQTVGTAGFSAGAALYTSMALDAANNPVVAFADVSTGQKASVMRWNGSAWQSIGTPGFTTSYAVYMSIVLSAGGSPIIAFRDGAAGDKATVLQWSHTWDTWFPVGSAGFSPGGTAFISLARDATGRLVIAFQDFQNGGRATVMRWNGTAWQVIGNAGFSSGTATYTSLALDAAGNPVVAYSDGTSGKATVMRWTGTVWQPVGSPMFSAAMATQISLALDPSGNPVVGYQDWAHNKATVMKWNDAVGWHSLGSAGFTQGWVAFTSLAMGADGSPYFAFRESNGSIVSTTVRRWNGTTWQVVGNESLAQSATEGISLKLDSSGNPVVAFSEHANGWKATVKRYAPAP